MKNYNEERYYRGSGIMNGIFNAASSLNSRRVARKAEKKKRKEAIKVKNVVYDSCECSGDYITYLLRSVEDDVNEN